MAVERALALAVEPTRGRGKPRIAAADAIEARAMWAARAADGVGVAIGRVAAVLGGRVRGACEEVAPCPPPTWLADARAAAMCSIARAVRTTHGLRAQGGERDARRRRLGDDGGGRLAASVADEALRAGAHARAPEAVPSAEVGEAVIRTAAVLRAVVALPSAPACAHAGLGQAAPVAATAVRARFRLTPRALPAREARALPALAAAVAAAPALAARLVAVQPRPPRLATALPRLADAVPAAATGAAQENLAGVAGIAGVALALAVDAVAVRRAGDARARRRGAEGRATV